MKTWYVGVGRVTDEEVHGGRAKLGDPEWQFSDGPLGSRSMSYDFLTLEEGLRELSPCIVVMESD